MTRKEKLEEILKTKGEKQTIMKSVEELNELAVELMKYLNKPQKIDIQNIIDEIGDVFIRIEQLKMIFDDEKIEKRINDKSNKMFDDLKNGEKQ